MHVGYFVSRFPHISETFIVRELNAVEATGQIQIELFSLFPPSNPLIHPATQSWVPRVRRPGVGAVVAGTLWALARHPLRTIGTSLIVLRGYARSGRLLRALAVIPIACAQARVVEDLAVEHIHAHYATYPALAAWVCHRLTGVSYSFTTHAHDLFLDQSLLFRKVRDAEFVIAISEFNRRFLKSYGGGRNAPVEVVHCGIDPSAYPFRMRQIPPDGPVRALCVANLTDYKGHEVLIDAIAQGGTSLARLELDLVGAGLLRGALEQQAGRLGIADRIRFHGGMIEPQVQDMLESADLFVLPSIVTSVGRMDGIPVVLMEALAAGLPVVATRLSGIPELIRDGDTGLLVEPGDPSELAQALARIVSDESHLNPKSGRRLIESEFEIGSSAKRLAGLFLQCAS